jgi:RNA polymerase sigma factor (sigma-70 family)
MEGISRSMTVEDAAPNEPRQDATYLAAAREFGPALVRLANAYEANEEHRRDLLQEMHLALWRSFAVFDERCALRTWVYRVAHNVAASHVQRQRRWSAGLCGLDQIDDKPAPDDTERTHDGHGTLERLFMATAATQRSGHFARESAASVHRFQRGISVRNFLEYAAAVDGL